MNSYRPIPLNRVAGESYNVGRQMTMEEAQRIAGQMGHVAQRISSGAADPNTGYMGVWAIPTEQGFIPLDQLGRNASPSDTWRNNPQPRPQGAPPPNAPPTAHMRGPIADTINQWQSGGVPNTPSVASTAQTPVRQGAIASYAAQQPQRQGAIAAYAQQQPQEQVIWPAPPGANAFAGPPQQSSISDRLRGPYRAPNDPSLLITGAKPPILPVMPPSTMASQPLQPQSRHYQFDPGFYGQQQQQQQDGWQQWLPWNWGR